MEPHLVADFVAFSATGEWPEKVKDIFAIYERYTNPDHLSKTGSITARMMTTLKRELKATLTTPANRLVRAIVACLVPALGTPGS